MAGLKGSCSSPSGALPTFTALRARSLCLSPFSSSLCRKTDCIDYFRDVCSVPFTSRSRKQRSFWETRGACNAHWCGHPLGSELFQEVTELLKPASPAVSPQPGQRPSSGWGPPSAVFSFTHLHKGLPFCLVT